MKALQCYVFDIFIFKTIVSLLQQQVIEIIKDKSSKYEQLYLIKSLFMKCQRMKFNKLASLIQITDLYVFVM